MTPLSEGEGALRTEGASGRAKLVREQREAAARRYKPERIRLLLVAEAPPSEDDRYFYFQFVKKQDSLFREVVKAILGESPTRYNKPQMLSRLMSKGVFMIDLKLDPIDGNDLKACVPDLIARCQKLEPEKVILIKVTVFDAAFEPMHGAGLPVIKKRLPFPGSGQQKNFHGGFADALSHVTLD